MRRLEAFFPGLQYSSPFKSRVADKGRDLVQVVSKGGRNLARSY